MVAKSTKKIWGEIVPYIREELRSRFDVAVAMAQEGMVNDAVEQIVYNVIGMEPKVLDGCLNYVFTQMLRKVEELVVVKIIIDLVINSLFWNRPKYIRFERVEGLLGRMIKEYHRRGWERREQVIEIIKEIIKSNDNKTNAYEDECIDRNGDLK